MAFLALLENFFTYKIPRILTIIFNVIQFWFVPTILFLSYQLSVPYKPALLIGLSFAFTSVSITFMLFMLKNNSADNNSMSFFKSILSSFYVSFISVGILNYTFYKLSSKNDFPSIIGSFINYPQFFLLVLGFTSLTYMKHKSKYILSVSSFIIFVLSSIKIHNLKGYLTSILDFNLIHKIDFNYGNLLILLIPISLIASGIWIYYETKNKSSLWMLIGSLILFIGFLLTMTSFEIFYRYKSVVDTLITQANFISIGVFESLYLFAFAFMGLGLLGFRKETKQAEDVQ